MLCPLIAQAETISLLSFQNVIPAMALSRSYLELMAEAIGLALSNQRLRDALLLFDPLTNQRNRYHLKIVLRAQLSQTQITAQPVICLVIDIDHFKSMNDNFGYDAG